MFGYVKIHAPELRMREYECYKSYYCGICRSMGKCTGQCSRMALNYDSVFLVLVRSTMAGETPQFGPFRCLVHPLKKRTAVKSSPVMDYCADASALLTYHKLLDDKDDESGFRKIRSFFARLFFRKGYQKAKKRHPQLDESIRNARNELSKLEHSEENLPPEAYAEVSAKMVQAVFSEGLEGSQKVIASAIGKELGKWIYLVDAIDDWESDCKHHRFNPFQKEFSGTPTETDWATARLSLMTILTELEKAFVLLDFPTDFPESKELLCNILYLGLVQTADHIIKKKTVVPAAPNI